jgi:macrolide-specific efflux system membrane fusion protein
MTVEAAVSEADVTKLVQGMEVYFTTLGGGGRRWYSELRQILPTPVVTNNVVLYTALFDVDNADAALYSSMTAQIFFVTSSARNVLKVPVGALTYINDDGRPAGAAQAFRRGDGAGEREGRAERLASMDPEMAERIAKRRADFQAQGDGFPAERPAAAVGRPTVATVQVAISENEFETREIRVGVTSRIAAEVLSGLEDGDQVVAGVIQSRSGDQQQRPRSFGGIR